MPASQGPAETTPAERTDGVIAPEELAAYEHVLFSDTWSLESLAAVIGRGTDEAAAVVDGLVERKLLRASQQDDSRLVPASPLVGLGRMASQAEQDLLERTQYVHRLRLLTSSLMERFDQQRSARSAEGYEVVSGRDATVTRVSELLRHATQSVDTVVTTPPTERALEQARVGDLTLLDRGIAARGLYLESHRRQSPQLREHLAWLTGLGAQVRVAGMLPVRFMLIDRSVAAVSMQADDAAPGAVIVQTEGLVQLAVALFEMLWESAAEVGATKAEEESADGLGLNELELAVLRLMAKGNKDLAVSRRTGLSVRSVRRVVATLSERLGADSRFELALRCRDLDLL